MFRILAIAVMIVGTMQIALGQDGIISGDTTKKTSSETSEATVSESQGARVLAIIGADPGKGIESIKIPDEVKAGKKFPVKISTFGNGCVSKDEISVIKHGNEVDLFVFNKTLATEPGVMCTMIHKEIPYTTYLRFDEKGVGTIRVWARVSSDGSSMGMPVLLQLTTVVR